MSRVRSLERGTSISLCASLGFDVKEPLMLMREFTTTTESYQVRSYGILRAISASNLTPETRIKC